MAVPLIQIQGVIKSYPALRPLRVASFTVHGSDRLVLRGFDEGAAEMLVHLITGAALPDEGTVIVADRDTRGIATDTEWLTSLDRFGIVTHRAVLLEGMSLAANLALPLTMAIDPLEPEMLERVTRDAEAAGLPATALDRPIAELGEEDRLRVHLSRAAAIGPEIVLLEHPTSRLTDRAAAARIGQTLKDLSTARGFGWIALTEDADFADATGGTVMKLEAATGKIAPPRKGWRGWLGPSIS